MNKFSFGVEGTEAQDVSLFTPSVWAHNKCPEFEARQSDSRSCWSELHCIENSSSQYCRNYYILALDSAKLPHVALPIFLDSHFLHEPHLCSRTPLAIQKPTLRWSKQASKGEMRKKNLRSCMGGKDRGQLRERWCQAEAKPFNSGLCLNWARSQFCHLLAVEPWLHRFPSL